MLHHVRCPPLYIPWCAVKHADLVQVILTTQCLCPIQLEFQYVTGHQDEFTHFEDLPPLAQLNVQANHMAKQALHVLGSTNTPALLSALPGVTWYLLIQDCPISSEPCLEILNHLSTLTAIPYWISKGQLTNHLALLVNWSLLEHALSSHPPTYHMWLSKFASGHSTVGQTVHHWKHWNSPVCPVCQLTEEDTNHIFMCLHANHMAHWHALMDILQQWLVLAKTHPAISWCIITTLHGCSLLSFSSNAWWSCQPAAVAQDQIGFFGFLMGHLSPEWETLQTLYGHQQGHLSSTSTWAKGLCLQLLYLSHGMWIFHNQQVQATLLDTQTCSLTHDIQHKFSLGISSLLLQD